MIYGDLRKVIFVLIWYCSLVFLIWFAFDQLSIQCFSFSTQCELVHSTLPHGSSVLVSFREFNKLFIYRSAYVYCILLTKNNKCFNVQYCIGLISNWLAGPLN